MHISRWVPLSPDGLFLFEVIISMSDNKKYYYLKLKENFFESDTLILLEAQKDGYLYSNILLKLYLRSLKNDGRLAFNNLIPYNAEMLATLTRHQVGTVEKALAMFEQLGLIEILDNGVIYMTDIQNFIGRSSSEADRQREYQKRITDEKQKLLEPCKESCKKSNKESCKESNKKNTPETEIELETEIDIDDADSKKKNSKKTSLSKQVDEVIEAYKSICKSYTKIKVISAERKKDIEKSLKTLTVEQIKECFELAEHNYLLKGMIMEGKDGKEPWKASFDWLIQEKNLVKIFNENYAEYDDRVYDINKGGNNNGGTQQDSKEESSTVWGGIDFSGIYI